MTKLITQRYYRTAIKVDLDRLNQEAERLAWDDQNKQFRTQTSIQNSEGDEDYLEGTGSKPGHWDTQWNSLRSDLLGTWWEEFFAGLPWPVYRTRIMIMPPRTCYSIHQDTSPRLHIALRTRPQARFIFTEPAEIIHIPADQHIWWVDTRHEHTAINASMEHRWHLLMSMDNTPDH
jgi:hypothetical protein